MLPQQQLPWYHVHALHAICCMLHVLLHAVCLHALKVLHALHAGSQRMQDAYTSEQHSR